MRRPSVAFALAASVLVGMALVEPRYHLMLGLVSFALVRWWVPEVARSLGRPKRWLIALLGLGALGAWLGTQDTHAHGYHWSTEGTLSACTMVVRAFALMLLGASLSAWIPARKILDRVSSSHVRHLFEVVLVAANLVPVLVKALEDAWAALRERRPGWRRLPQRLGLLSVHAVVRSARLAEAIAFDMALAAHNQSAPSSSSTSER